VGAAKPNVQTFSATLFNLHVKHRRINYFV
jgi:hypothetical protein